MATVLDLAREVRHRLVSKDTGCLTVDYSDDTVALHFWDGTVATERTVFMSCFTRNPVDYQFKSMEIRETGKPGTGASLLIEAMEAIDPKSLLRVWEPYAEWRVRFRTDPEIHNTLVKEHLVTDVGRLRRLMRLAVSGSATLEAPKTLITDEMDDIQNAFDRRNWHKVLGVDRKSVDSDLKKAYRRLARRFHPDRWAMSSDMKMRDRIEQTFQRVSAAYSELQRPRPTMQRLIAGTKPKRSFWEKLGFARSK